MKRVFSAAIAAALVLSLAVTASAETKVPTDATLQVAGSALATQPCVAAAQGQIALQIGEAALSMETASIERLLPAEIPVVGQRADGALEMTLPASSGCAGASLKTARAVIGKTAELPFGIMFTEVAPREGLSSTARGLLGLRDGGTCASQGNGLMRCEGAQTIDGVRVPVVYLLAENPAETIASGAPLYALCRPRAEVLECEIADDLEGRLGMRMMIPAGAPDLAQLKAERERALAFVAKIRR